MRIWEKLFGKRYLEWDEYKDKIDALEEKNWNETTKQKFRVSK